MRFSVVIPAYNVADYLEKCVASVRAQTCADWEVLLVDDGSTDGVTGKLCDALGQGDDRFRVIHQENGGLGAARNTGMEAARGEYLVFLDSDDYLAPHMLETLRQRIEATHCDVYTFGFFVDKMVIPVSGIWMICRWEYRSRWQSIPVCCSRRPTPGLVFTGVPFSSTAACGIPAASGLRTSAPL